MAEQTPPLPRLRMGTRGSALARWQTDHIALLLQQAWPDLQIEITVLHTQGDRILDKPLPMIGGKGLFTAELEAALHADTIDLAVHSLKDLPTEMEAGLTIGAIPQRAPVHDIVVSRSGCPLAQLPSGAVIGTSSRRRAAQLRRHFPHFVMADIRGNVDTRIRKALDLDGPYDAIVLARAGIERLGHAGAISEVLPLEMMLPAPGQGALAVQCRDDQLLRRLLAPLDDAHTHAAVDAERAFLRGLGGGCAVPIAALATTDGNRLHIRGRITALDGARQIDVELSGAATEADQMGEQLARLALTHGAGELLAETAL